LSNTWNVNVDNDNKNKVGNVNFTGFSNLIAGSAGDTFNINGVMNDLTGGIGIDTFNINGGSVVTINMGAGDDIIHAKGGVVDSAYGGEGKDTFDISGGEITYKDGGKGNDSLASSELNYEFTIGTDLNGFETVEALQGGGTITGQVLTSTWTITGLDQGKVIDSTMENALNFIGFSNLIGTEATDKFTITGTLAKLSGLIDGGGGSDDSLTLSNNQNYLVELGDEVTDNLNVNRVETITAHLSSSNTLIADNTTNLWTIDKANGGSINDGSTLTEFTHFTNLQGGSAKDEFTVSAGGASSIKLEGGADLFTSTGGYVALIEGGAGDDSFTLNDLAAIGKIDGGANIDTVTLSGDEQTVTLGTNVTKVETINATDATLAAQALTNTWKITGANSGTVSNSVEGTVNFGGFASLTGNEATDNFTLTGALAQLSGLIDGGAGSDDSLTLSNNQNYLVELGDEVTANLNVNRVETITAHQSSSNTLIADNTTNRWTIDKANGGSITDGSTLTEFTHFTNLQGGSVKDEFTVSAGGASSIKLGGGADAFTSTGGYVALVEGGNGDDGFTLNDLVAIGKIDGGANIDTVTLLGDDQTVTLGTNITAVETINATDATLVAQALTNTWEITGANSGTVSNSVEGTVNFGGVANLTGNEATDNFTITGALAKLSGLMDGGGGSDDSLTLFNNQNYLVELGDEVTDNLNVNRVETITAHLSSSNTLIADNTTNLWTIDKANGGSITDGSTLTEFTHFTNLQGGSAKDEFTVSAGGASSIKLGGGADLFTSTGGYVALVEGGAGDDGFTLNDIAAIGKIDGGANIDTVTLLGEDQTVTLGTNVTKVETLNATDATLVAQNLANKWKVTDNNNGTLSNSAEDTVSFDGFANLVGGSENDIFEIVSFDYITLINGGTHPDTENHIEADTVKLTSDNQKVIVGENIVNIESIVAAGGSNILQGADTDNDWLISSLNNGDVNGISFSNFTDLQGGTLDDRFVLSSMNDISGVIDGGANVKGDTVTLTDDHQIVKLGNDIEGIETVNAAGGRNTLFAKNETNIWDLTNLNSGEVNSITFENFTDLNGGSLVDTFNVSVNGAVTGIINGGNGADELIVELNNQTRTESGSVNFVGGNDDATDVVVIKGSGVANTFTETYQPNVLVDDMQFDQLSYENKANGANVAVNFRDVGTVNDDIQTSSLVIKNAGADDTLYLSNVVFGAKSNLVNVSYMSTNKENISVQAFDNGSLELLDSVAVNGSLTITANNVVQTQGIISAGSLILDGVASAGLNDAIETNISELQVLNHSGEMYLNQQGDLLLTAINHTTGLINITARESISSDANLSSSGELALKAQAINLTGANKLEGELDLTASDIVINNDSITRLAGITGSNAMVTSGETITASGDINVSANGNGVATFISEKGDVILDGSNTVDSLNITAGNNISLANLTASKFTAQAKNGDISSLGILDISQNYDGITTSLIANNGSISLLNANNNFNKVSLTANDAQITDKNGLSVLDSQLSNGLVVNANGELNLGTISAGSSMFLDAGTGTILSNQSNLTAPKITLRANTGIGSGSYADLVGTAPDNTGSLNINTALLSAINSSSGIVNISNAQAVTITDLRNNGDIVFTNTGDMTLQTSQVEGAKVGVMKGAIDANYGQSINNAVYSGNVAILNEGLDSIYTTALYGNESEADITAENLLVNSVTNFGTAAQPIRVRVNNDLILFGVQASVNYYGAAPVTVTTSKGLSLQVVSTVAGLSYQQLIEVESLSEVDPAIFTDVRNYNMDNISVLLPRDQRYEEDEEDDEDEYVGEDVQGLLSVSVNK
jgi:hypothetical protein